MRGRTNVGGGGLEINGDIEQWLVKDGEIIQEGDFVQIETMKDSGRTPSRIDPKRIFNLSDGRQINLFTSSFKVCFALETFGEDGVGVPVIYTTNVSVQNNYYGYAFWKVAKVDTDKFIIATGSEAVTSGNYSTTYTIYLLEFDVTDDTFVVTQKGVFGSVSGWIEEQSTKHANPSIIEIKPLNSQYFAVIYSRRQNINDTYGYLSAMVYDYVNGSVVQTLFSSIIINFNEELRGNRLLYRKNSTNSFTIYYAYNTMKVHYFNFDLNNATIIQDGNTLIVQRVSPYLDFEYLGSLCWEGVETANNVVNVFNNQVFLLYFNHSESKITILKKYDLSTGYLIKGAFNYKGNAYVYNSGGTVFRIDQYDVSEPSTNAIWDVGNECHVLEEVTSDIFCTYTGLSRRTVENGTNNLVKISSVETIKKYVDKIDGVSDMDGVGGDTIKIYVPASS